MRSRRRTPQTLMMRMLLQWSLRPEEIDALFEREARGQYTRELTMSAMVDLTAPVVCGIHRSTRASYSHAAAPVGASLQAVYCKLAGVETHVSEALVRKVTRKLTGLIDTMDGAREASPPGYNVKIPDGKCLAATEHRDR